MPATRRLDAVARGVAGIGEPRAARSDARAHAIARPQSSSLDVDLRTIGAVGKLRRVMI